MDTNKANRKRGVVASRVKLLHAMLEAGFKTQVALAEHIAKKENIDSPPKDMVNRAFRQQSVDPKSLQRIADALNVPAYQLFLSSEEINQENDDTDEPAVQNPYLIDEKEKNNKTVRHLKSFQFGPALILLSLSIVILISVAMVDEIESTETNEPRNPALIELSILIKSKVDLDLGFVDALRDQLDRHFTVAEIDNSNDHSPDNHELVRKYETDGLVSIISHQRKRFTLLEVRLLYQEIESVVAYKVINTAYFRHHKNNLANELANEVITTISSSENRPPITQKDIVLWNEYLDARLLLDENRIEETRHSIIATLLGIIELSPEFAEAHAALCQAYRAQSWVEDEKESLSNAEKHCATALKLNPNSSYILAMNGELANLTGDLDAAKSFFNRIQINWQEDPNALLGLVRIYVRNFEQSNDKSILRDAKAMMNKAIEIEPFYYLHHDQLGTVHYYLNELEASHQAYFEAAKLNNNPVSLVNVAVSMMCMGSFDDSKEVLSSLKNRYPNSHLGDIYNATLHFYLGDFESARTYMYQGLDKLDGNQRIHQYWGTLGDIESNLENLAEANEAYKYASDAVQFYYLRDMDGVWEHVAEQYYKMKIAEIENREFNLPDEFKSRLFAYNPEKLSSGVNMRVALIYKNLGNSKSAKAHFIPAANQCSLYQHHPNLSFLLETKVDT